MWNARRWGDFSILLNKGVQQQADSADRQRNTYKRNQVNHPSKNSLPDRRERAGRQVDGQAHKPVQHRLEGEAGLNIQGGVGGQLATGETHEGH